MACRMKLWAWFLVCEDGGAAPSVSSPLGAQFASAKEPTAASFICGTPACCAAAVSTGLQSLPPLLPPLRCGDDDNDDHQCERRGGADDDLSPAPARERAKAAEEAGGTRGETRALRYRWRLGGRRGRRGSRGRGRRGSPAPAARLRDLRDLRLRGEQSQVLRQALGKSIRLGIALQVPNGIGAPDRIGLPQQIVAEADLGVRVRAADLGQRRARPRAHLIRRDAQQGADVVIALPPFEQQLKHRALFVRDRHERGSLGQRRWAAAALMSRLLGARGAGRTRAGRRHRSRARL